MKWYVPVVGFVAGFLIARAVDKLAVDCKCDCDDDVIVEETQD